MAEIWEQYSKDRWPNEEALEMLATLREYGYKPHIDGGSHPGSFIFSPEETANIIEEMFRLRNLEY